MTSKVVVIKGCWQCPHFDDVYYTYNSTCDLLNDKKIEDKSIIDSQCPLEDFTEVESE